VRVREVPIRIEDVLTAGKETISPPGKGLWALPWMKVGWTHRATFIQGSAAVAT
jgi:hypothetical protein